MGFNLVFKGEVKTWPCIQVNAVSVDEIQVSVKMGQNISHFV